MLTNPKTTEKATPPMKTIPHSEIIARWSDPNARPLFKGKLIDNDGCCCAQGDILRTYCGYSDEQLRSMVQSKADAEVAKKLGISRFHAILIRNVNDKKDGCPQDVLSNPEKIIGDQAPIMLAFARHLDRMTSEQWDAARDAARDAAWEAGYAMHEIQGAAIMRAKGTPFYFLPMFGFADPEAVMVEDAKYAAQ